MATGVQQPTREELLESIQVLRTRNYHLQKMLEEAKRTWLDEVAVRIFLVEVAGKTDAAKWAYGRAEEFIAEGEARRKAGKRSEASQEALEGGSKGPE